MTFKNVMWLGALCTVGLLACEEDYAQNQAGISVNGNGNIDAVDPEPEHDNRVTPPIREPTCEDSPAPSTLIGPDVDISILLDMRVPGLEVENPKPPILVHRDNTTWIGLVHSNPDNEPWLFDVGYASYNPHSGWQVEPHLVDGYSATDMDVWDGDVRFTTLNASNHTILRSESQGWAAEGTPLEYLAYRMSRAPDGRLALLSKDPDGFYIARSDGPSDWQVQHLGDFDFKYYDEPSAVWLPDGALGMLWTQRNSEVLFFDSDGATEVAWMHNPGSTYETHGPLVMSDGRLVALASGEDSLLYERTDEGWMPQTAVVPPPLPTRDSCPVEEEPFSGQPCEFASSFDQVVGLLAWNDEPLMVRYRKRAPYRIYRECLQHGFELDTPVCDRYGDWEESGSHTNPRCNDLVVGDAIVPLDPPLPPQYIMNPTAVVDEQGRIHLAIYARDNDAEGNPVFQNHLRYIVLAVTPR